MNTISLILLLGKDFIKRLLTYDPTNRLSAIQALNHPWIWNNGKKKFKFTILDEYERIE